MIVGHVCAEDILVQQKPKKGSTQKIKEQLVDDLDDLLSMTTAAQRSLADLTDEIASAIKQIAGQQKGDLSTNNKQILEKYNQKINSLQKTLHTLNEQSHLVVIS